MLLTAEYFSLRYIRTLFFFCFVLFFLVTALLKCTTYSIEFTLLKYIMGFPGGAVVKKATFNEGDLGLIPGLGKSPGEGKGNLLQYSCLENSMDRGVW